MDQKRYDRQIKLKELGKVGQQRLLDAHVTIVGCGGLGSIAAPYLAGAGVGKLTLIDGDRPDMSNVHRQVFYTGHEEETKAETLANHLKNLNPEVELRVVPEMLSKANIENAIDSTNLVLECSDSVLCKYLVNDYCHLENIPLVYGAIHKYEGYLSFFENIDDLSIHLRDIFPEPDLEIQSCSEVGVLNTIAGLIGLLQANEAIKFITQIGNNLNGKLLQYDCLSNEQLNIKLSKNWKDDIEELYEEQEYTEESCLSIPEVEPKVIYDQLNEYRIISILSPSEHISISENTERYDKDLVQNKIENSNAKKTLLYCRTGRQSSLLISQLLKNDPSLKIYNIRGGLMAYQKFKALS